MTDGLMVAGVDEVGRGTWAGPVVTGAVILPSEHPIEGLTDSKKLTEKARIRLDREIRQHSLAYAIGLASAQEVDDYGICEANFLAMRRAVDGLNIVPDKVLVDGNERPELGYVTETVIGGDLTVPAISAASIIAKVARDHMMVEAAEKYPGYGFEKNKGYGTAIHSRGLADLGACALHRRSYKPVARAIAAYEASTTGPSAAA